MGETPPLNELAARKRLVQAKMELHRAEMALYSHQILSPIETASSGISTLAANPMVRVGVIAGLGVLLFSGRRKLIGRTLGFVTPMILPNIRQFLMKQGMNLVMKGIQRFSL